MNAVTHPYGTQRKAEVVTVLTSGVLMLVDEKGEGHFLMGTGSDPCAIGDKGTLTFTQGGPTGGYWKFTKDK